MCFVSSDVNFSSSAPFELRLPVVAVSVTLLIIFVLKPLW